MNDEGYEPKYIQPIKVWLIIFTFIKMMQLIRVYQAMGMFIKLFLNVLIDINIFAQFYILLTTFFALCFAALDTETDDDIDLGKGLGDYGRLWLMVWRNSVTKLSMPMYENIMS